MARRKQVLLRFTCEGSDSSAEVHLLIYTPMSEKAVPAFLGLNFYGNHTITADKGVRISTAWMRDNPSRLGLSRIHAVEILTPLSAVMV